MIGLSELLLLLATVAMSWWHSRLIAAGRPILHGAWSAVYAALVAGGLWWNWSHLDAVQVGLYSFAASAGHLSAFNVALNMFRGLPWTYTSKTSGSILDRMEIRLFGGKVWLLEIMLAVAFLITQLFL